MDAILLSSGYKLVQSNDAMQSRKNPKEARNGACRDYPAVSRVRQERERQAVSYRDNPFLREN
jgi:hypothetical protein